ncbi:MAG: LuxR C-terminal-related transcriptional regulator [Phycisphaerae bacterium]
MSDTRSITESVQQNQSQSPDYQQTIRLCLVGGKRILRNAMQQFFRSSGFDVSQVVEDDGQLGHRLQNGLADETDVMLLIVSGGPFTTFHRINDTLSRTNRALPMVVLSEQASRGQVYAALRIGAKAYVNLDADPAELVKAIEMASKDKVYLAPDAAELLVNDISSAIEPSSSSRLPSVELSRREIEIVQLLCEGLSSKEIARRLHISAKTVENHRYNIYRKCEVDSIAGLMRHAIQHGMISI